MPIYEYFCPVCNDVFEVICLSSAASPRTSAVCEVCGGEAGKIPSASLFYLSPGGVGGYDKPGMCGIDYRGSAHLDEPDRAPDGITGGPQIDWKARHRRSMARRAEIKRRGREAGEFLRSR